MSAPSFLPVLPVLPFVNGFQDDTEKVKNVKTKDVFVVNEKGEVINKIVIAVDSNDELFKIEPPSGCFYVDGSCDIDIGDRVCCRNVMINDQADDKETRKRKIKEGLKQARKSMTATGLEIVESAEIMKIYDASEHKEGV